MTSGDNVSPVNEDDKSRSDLAVIGGRATEEERLLIDTAAAKLNKRRGHFIIEAAVERARVVLAVPA